MKITKDDRFPHDYKGAYVTQEHYTMTSNGRSLHVHSPTFTEPTVDRCFLQLVDRYTRTLPAWQATIVEESKELLLPPRWTLSPLDQIKVANLLWEHNGSPLETGYRLKEDLKRCLRYNRPADRVKLMQTIFGDRQGDIASSFRRLIHLLEPSA